MFIKDIHTASPFKDLFPIKEKVVEKLYWDMQQNGFDPSTPIVLWESHDSIVIDGHIRLRAANKAGLIQVPVILKRFETEEEAVKYAIHCQRDRRNLTDMEIAKCIETLDKRKDKLANLKQNHTEAPDGTSGKTASETAEVLGINHRKVERVRTVLDKGSEEVKEAVRSGKMSINSAYNQTVGAQKKTAPPKKGSKESLQLAVEEIEQIEKVFEIIKERLNREQMRELLKYIARELIKGKE